MPNSRRRGRRRRRRRSTLVNDSLTPAKEVSALSSPAADERTATAASARPVLLGVLGGEPLVGTGDLGPQVVGYGRRVDDLLEPVCRARRADRWGWNRGSPSGRGAWSRAPLVSITCRKPRVATTKPGGTGKPDRVSSPRFAPLPPNHRASDSAISGNQTDRRGRFAACGSLCAHRTKTYGDVGGKDRAEGHRRSA